MRILLVSATLAECKGLLKEDQNSPLTGVLNKNFLKNVKAEILITGVGQVATAFHLGRVLKTENFDLVINIGLAGAFSTNLSLGTVVQVVQDQFADLGVEDNDKFIDLFDLGLIKADELPYQNKVLVPLTFSGSNLKKMDIPSVNGITVNKVHGNALSIKAISQQFPAEVESMEGGAFFYACNLSGVPSLQVRAISNYVEPRNRDAWQIEKALTALWDIISKYLIHIETL